MSELNAVDLFCGLGGASIGLQSAGVNVIGAIDVDQEALDVYQNNPVEVEPFQADLKDVTFQQIADHYGFQKRDVDLVVGCPPCQNFSYLRDTDPWPEDEPKDELLKAFCSRVEEANPDYVLFENVPGIASRDDGQYLKWLKNTMDDLEYKRDIDNLNAADYGVPQYRRRTIGLFVKKNVGVSPELPSPTHIDPENQEDSERKPWETVEDTISDLPPLEAGEEWDEDPAHRASNHQKSTIDRIKAVPKDGGSRTDIEDPKHELDCHKNLENSFTAKNVYGRMAWEKPAPTLTTRCTTPSCGRFTHPEQNRGISFREAARLMSIPDFDLTMKNGTAERVIGNAVPPRLIQMVLNSFA